MRLCFAACPRKGKAKLAGLMGQRMWYSDMDLFTCYTDKGGAKNYAIFYIDV
jgi:hypothetical protein